jgi:hypothetical protein
VAADIDIASTASITFGVDVTAAAAAAAAVVVVTPVTPAAILFGPSPESSPGQKHDVSKSVFGY